MSHKFFGFVFTFFIGFSTIAQDIGIGLDENMKSNDEMYRVAIKTRPLNYLIFPLSFGSVINANLEAEFPIKNNLSISPGFQYLYVNTANSLFTSTSNQNTKGTTFSMRTDLKYYPLAAKREEYSEGFYVGPYLKIRAQATTTGTGSFFGIVALPGLMGGYTLISGKFAASYLIGGGFGYGPTANFGNTLIIDFRTGISVGFTI